MQKGLWVYKYLADHAPQASLINGKTITLYRNDEYEGKGLHAITLNVGPEKPEFWLGFVLHKI